MGRLAVYKYVAMMFLVFQLVLTAFTFTGLFGGDVNPVGHSARAMLVYVLPLLIIANLLMIIYWLLRRRWILALVPVITVACCIPYLGTFLQPGTLDKAAADQQRGIKVASYNVAMFNRETSGFMALDILAQMRRQKVDICCLQEYNDISGDKHNTDSWREYFPHFKIGRDDMVIFSRYPIKDSKTILFDDTNNSAMWADIDINGDVVRVFNAHLQTTGISRTMHQADKLARQNIDVGNSTLLKAIFGNYTLGLIFRAGQASTIANEKRNSDNPCIVCGDFNDVPYSYVYNTMLGNMVDGFKECGAGWMYTFRGLKAARIDYIFHDPALKGLIYYQDSELTYSDHYPVFMKLSLR
ncbi:MAG: endonuclease/exonuclease/phosphatase family protein [Prevotella sp.]|nr:endonuclease/exonuclease/phosphatase family protein [Prevotella sp.]